MEEHIKNGFQQLFNGKKRGKKIWEPFSLLDRSDIFIISFRSKSSKIDVSGSPLPSSSWSLNKKFFRWDPKIDFGEETRCSSIQYPSQCSWGYLTISRPKCLSIITMIWHQYDKETEINEKKHTVYLTEYKSFHSFRLIGGELSLLLCPLYFSQCYSIR